VFPNELLRPPTDDESEPRLDATPGTD